MPITDDARWLALCASKGQESPDPRTKIGCLIIGPDGSIRCAACNDYPQGILPGVGKRAEAPLKYVWFEHAERNAIYQAARASPCGLPAPTGKSLSNSKARKSGLTLPGPISRNPAERRYMRQVRMYVDGYNFYYGIKRKYHLDRIEKGQKSWIGLAGVTSAVLAST